MISMDAYVQKLPFNDQNQNSIVQGKNK